MSFFTPVQTWRIPESAFAASLEEMARDGHYGDEGVALWLGHRADGHAEVTHVVVLRGPGIIKRPDQLVIQTSLVNELTDLAVTHNAVLVGQIHSHGQCFGTDLSHADRTYGIAVPSYLSLVAPDYAQRPVTRIQDCGVHVFDPPNGYRRLSPAEIGRRIQIVATGPVPILTAGKE